MNPVSPSLALFSSAGCLPPPAVWLAGIFSWSYPYEF